MDHHFLVACRLPRCFLELGEKRLPKKYVDIDFWVVGKFPCRVFWKVFSRQTLLYISFGWVNLSISCNKEVFMICVYTYPDHPFGVILSSHVR